MIIIATADSINTNFNCLDSTNACINNFIFILNAKNNESTVDYGVNATFTLTVYSGSLPNQETHPGIARTLDIPSNLFSANTSPY
jgi:hypothetical protein